MNREAALSYKSGVMFTRTFTGVAGLLLVTCLCLHAGPISFSGQFDPALATVQLNGGNGQFLTGGAPASVTVVGSDSGTDQAIYTLVTWNVTSPVTNLWFYWVYQTSDCCGPSWDPAGYYLNGSYIQLSNDSGPDLQSGMVTIASLSPGDSFGFYVYTVDDIEGPASLKITGVPEPGTFALLGVGGLALLVRRASRSGRKATA